MSRISSISIATIDDLPTIVEIYNQAIRSKNATGDMDKFTVKERVEWFDKFDDNNYPIYVAKIGDSVTGYATLSPYREGRKAMNRIAESFYLDYSYHGLGIGSALVGYIISDCKEYIKILY
jgi:phosphinothricin acetyltransferase